MAKVIIEIRSYISCDAYVFEGSPYRLDEVDTLKDKVGNRAVEFIKGKNTFTGKLIDDEFYNSMIKRYTGR